MVKLTQSEPPREIQYLRAPWLEAKLVVREGATIETVPLSGGKECAELVRAILAESATEKFLAIFMDAKGKVNGIMEISSGTLTSSLVHPREVFAPAVMNRAATIIVAHNHPSGDPEPSIDDRATTRRLVRAGKLLGIELLDHVVVSRNGYVSFLERGWMN